GAAWSRTFVDGRLRVAAMRGLISVAAVAIAVDLIATPLIDWAIPLSRGLRIAIAVMTLVPVGIVLGIPMPTGLRMLAERASDLVPWAWGMNGALSVLGATLAIFVAMNWGFSMTLVAASATYLVALLALLRAAQPTRS